MNVILIISDTLRRDFLGCYGNEDILTPHIDRFAKQSVVFNEARVSSFPTVPCRNDIMTGRWTLGYKPWSPLGEDEIVLSEILNEGGYVTACFADVPNAFSPGYNYQRGFQAHEWIRGQEIDPFKTTPIDKELPCDPDKLRMGGDWTYKYLQNVSERKYEEDYFPAKTMRKAAKWLEKNRNQDFFLYVDTFDPHEPWDPPSHYLELYEPEGYEGQEVIYPRYDKWENFMSREELEHCRNLYSGEVSLVDKWVGYLLERVDDLSLSEKTAVIFTSDHGFYLGEHGYIGKSILTKDKHEPLPLYPEVSRIPLLVRLPGEEHRRSSALAQPVDLMPTILKLFGQNPPQTAQGKSLVPVLEGDDDLREFAVSSPTLSGSHVEVPHPVNRATITDKEWALIAGATSDPETVEETKMVDGSEREITQIYGPIKPELYHLTEDLWCEKNIISQNLKTARKLHRSFIEFLREIGVNEDHITYFEKLSLEGEINN